MKFFHRTTEENWKKIQDEGILYGVVECSNNGIKSIAPYRYTYLSPDDFGESYGKILLEVEYEPKGKPFDNYGFNPPKNEYCWQFSVFVSISIENVKNIKYEN